MHPPLVCRCKEALAAHNKVQEDLLRARRENQDRSQQYWAIKRLLTELKLSSVDDLTAEVRF